MEKVTIKCPGCGCAVDFYDCDFHNTENSNPDADICFHCGISIPRKFCEELGPEYLEEYNASL